MLFSIIKKKYLSSFVIFTELALINDQPRKATVVARGSVRLAALRRDAFVRLLGPIMDIFRRNAAEYNMQQQNTTQNTSVYNPTVHPHQESDDNHVPSQGSGDDDMAVDVDDSATTRSRKSGYSGAGGVDVL